MPVEVRRMVGCLPSSRSSTTMIRSIRHSMPNVIATRGAATTVVDEKAMMRPATPAPYSVENASKRRMSSAPKKLNTRESWPPAASRLSAMALRVVGVVRRWWGMW